ncbi:MAG: DNA-protecting protein DprA [Alistipes sp.]|nr:DNA-protecting protein DprA [Alistipes sp.]
MTIEDIALTYVQRLNAANTVKLLEEFGDARAIYAAGASELMRRGVRSAELARRIVAREGFAEAERELRRCEREGVRPIASTDAEYPQMMTFGVADYPHVIYVMGSVGALTGRMLTVVGTRMPGRSAVTCDLLIGELADCVDDVRVVSGLAFGTDANAHRAALDAKVPTVAVVPSVLPDIMPKNHSYIAEKILSSGGAIVSELNMASGRHKGSYIQRNRIMAAMSEGTLVVESLPAGGSMATTELALSYNRTLMAVPGRPTDGLSSGPNMLIRTHRAEMVCSGSDIAGCLGWPLAERIAEVAQRPRVELSDDGYRIMACLSGGEAMSTDALMSLCGLDIGTVMATMTELEMQGVVRAVPGGKYESCNML